MGRPGGGTLSDNSALQNEDQPMSGFAATAGVSPDRVIDMLASSMELAGVSLGSRLGCWAAVAAGGPNGVDAGELAERCGMDARYAREWLEAMGAGGWLEVADAAPYARRFRLAPGTEPMLLSVEGDSYLDPLIRQVTASQLRLRQLEQAYRDGSGIAWGDQDAEVRTAQGEINRTPLRRQLAGWIRSALPDVAHRLDDGGWAADVGCGYGWASVGLAEGFPKIYVDAFDPDTASALGARANVAGCGLNDRVLVHSSGFGGQPTGPYSLIVMAEMLHDVPDPIGLLTTCRERLDEDGVILVADMKVNADYTAPADPIERMMYGFSVLVCLPGAMGGDATAATGTVMRPSILEGYADAAGLIATELSIEHDTWRFWVLTQQP